MGDKNGIDCSIKKRKHERFETCHNLITTFSTIPQKSKEKERKSFLEHIKMSLKYATQNAMSGSNQVIPIH